MRIVLRERGFSGLELAEGIFHRLQKNDNLLLRAMAEASALR